MKIKKFMEMNMSSNGGDARAIKYFIENLKGERLVDCFYDPETGLRQEYREGSKQAPSMFLEEVEGSNYSSITGIFEGAILDSEMHQWDIIEKSSCVGILIRAKYKL